ncbi:unnamed protein product [Rotaria socialis]|nr:unnamed protein product [Rotaria socialis]CAF5015952.1 unnamed protein product [Rotaria socialis]
MNDPNNTYKWFLNLQQFLDALKLRVTVWQEVKQKRPSISSSLRILLITDIIFKIDFDTQNKKKDDRLRLRTWNIPIKQELRAHRQRSWEQFI